MFVKPTIINIDLIRMDGGTQPRQGISWEIAYEYGDLMAEGVKLPPVTVFYDGSEYWLADGFHRVHAAKSQDIADITADVFQGTLEDAQWYSFGANKSHGLQRSNDDKYRAVQAALKHPMCAGLSDRAIAKHVGVDHKTVAGYRAKLTGEIPQSKLRKGSDGRTINTSNIGKKAEQAQPKPEAQPHPYPTPEREELQFPVKKEHAQKEAEIFLARVVALVDARIPEDLKEAEAVLAGILARREAAGGLTAYEARTASWGCI